MHQPIILLGAARSGTKFLRDVIGESVSVAKVPYDTSYVWRLGNEQRDDDAFTRADAAGRVRSFAPKQLRRIAGLKNGDNRRLLEKSVSNTLRVDFVDEIFPDARFVHLVRDGRAVTESSMRLWQAPPDWPILYRKLRDMPLSNVPYALWFVRNFAVGLINGRNGGKVWGPRYKDILDDIAANCTLEQICARQWTESVASARRQLSILPPERSYTVRYEDLLSDDGALDALLNFLALDDSNRIRDIFRAKAVHHNLHKWRDRLKSGQIAQITSVAAPELRRFGYLSCEQMLDGKRS